MTKKQARETSAYIFAKRELDILMEKCKDDKEALKMQKEITKDILKLVEDFCTQEHSGFSASYAISALNSLLNFQPLSPLTGNEDEWNKIDDTTMQNNRCPSVIKKIEGNKEHCYNLNLYLFSDNGGNTWFASREIEEKMNLSSEVEFPYNVNIKPRRIFIKCEKSSDNDKQIIFTDITNNEDEIKSLSDKWKSENN